MPIASSCLQQYNKGASNVRSRLISGGTPERWSGHPEVFPNPRGHPRSGGDPPANEEGRVRVPARRPPQCGPWRRQGASEVGDPSPKPIVHLAPCGRRRPAPAGRGELGVLALWQLAGADRVWCPMDGAALPIHPSVCPAPAGTRRREGGTPCVRRLSVTAGGGLGARGS